MPEVKDKITGQVIAKMPYGVAGKMAAEKMVVENPGYEIKDGAQRSEQMYAGGGKTGYNAIGNEMYQKGGEVEEDPLFGPKAVAAQKEQEKKEKYEKEHPIASGKKTFEQVTEEGVAKAKKRVKEGIKKQKRLQGDLKSKVEWETHGYKGDPGEYSEKKQKAINKAKLESTAEYIKWKKEKDAEKRKKKK